MDFKSDRPIYLQIRDYAFGCILGDCWKPGEKVPSVREMSVQLAVNTHTVAKAYELLESEGVIIPRRGMGFFLAEDARTRIKEEQRREFFANTLPEVFSTMKQLGIDINDIISRWNEGES